MTEQRPLTTERPMGSGAHLRVALIHYWLVGMRGGEKVLEALCEIFPDADIFTHVYVPAAVSPIIRRHRVHTSFIQRLPRAAHWYKRYLPLMPMALEALDLRGYDLVVSCESGPAKGVIPAANALHLCYCHTPMRYLWNMYQDYRDEAGPLTRLLMPPLAHYLRMVDALGANRVDYFLASSHGVGRRIAKYYRRDAQILFPPVEASAFHQVERPDDFFLVVGELVAYKRAEMAVRAFNRLRRPLVVIGGGEQLSQLRRLAGPTVQVLGPQPFAVLRDHYARCRALIFPGEEDFGIVPLEAMASGRPVIAYRKGGATETVVDGATGLFFDHPTEEALIEAVERFDAVADSFRPQTIVAHAAGFDRAVFKQRFRDIVAQRLA